MNKIEALKNIDLRVSGLRINQPDSAEYIRMQMVLEDVIGGMTEAQIYEARKSSIPMTKSEEKAESERISAAMNLNVDRPSI
jgi:hypothetical protein